jgi:hypothetical protein
MVDGSVCGSLSDFAMDGMVSDMHNPENMRRSHNLVNL